ncbi:Ribosomal protein L11 methyltransferase [Bienertia sinuspersici]
MLTSEEKQGRNDFIIDAANISRSATNNCGLMDLGYIGHDFTWSNNRGRKENTDERLDRFFVNQEWKKSTP